MPEQERLDAKEAERRLLHAQVAEREYWRFISLTWMKTFQWKLSSLVYLPRGQGITAESAQWTATAMIPASVWDNPRFRVIAKVPEQEIVRK